MASLASLSEFIEVRSTAILEMRPAMASWSAPQTIGVNANTTLTLARRVQHSSLKAHTGVRVHVGQGEQIGGSDKKVAVKSVNGEAPRTSDSHDGLEADLARQVPLQIHAIFVYLFWVVVRMKAWIVLELSAAILGHARKSGQVGIERVEHEQVDGYLDAGAIQSELFVEIGLRRHVRRVFVDVLVALLERADSHIGQTSLHYGDAAASRLEKLVGGSECAAHC
ncbi:hypothetical protein BpHYR1_005888 [Brachionus plicatilis]|uniref:Uncharacterized protein n=1 Tax=Brachionus plicatilis TaxID=10195 RepID=A0A3M7QLQ1_BRAPC|nr:hypothetical protein BpHYR1_005888 [Brachionus plicatilis]